MKQQLLSPLVTVLLLGLLSGEHLFAETLIETRFGNRSQLVPIENTHDGRIRGVLPEGVLEDSGWSGIGVEYRFEEDAIGGGLAWIEARLLGGERGQAQLKWNLPALSEPGRYRLDVLLAAAENAAVTFAIRSTSPPYTAHWEQTLRPGAYRQRETLDFALPAIEGNVALIAHMGRRGVLFFYDLSLIRRTEAELTAERERLLATAPDNLLPSAGFALGLPSGWSTGTHASRTREVQVESQPRPGPRGTVPLRFSSRQEGKSVSLYSSPIEPWIRDEAHTVRFFIRGTVHDGHVAVRVDDRTLASTPLPHSPNAWTEVVLPFTPDLTAPWHVLEWSLDGDIELDTLRITVGKTQPKQFSPSPEVALGGDPLRNHVILRGVDEEQIDFAVTGSEAGDVLQVRVYDVEGREFNLPSVDATGDALQRGTLSLEAVFPEHPYGPLRVEGQLLRNGEPVSRPVERVVHRLRRPRHWGQRAPESRFGTHISLYEPHLHSMKSIGINWVRLHGPNGKYVYWSGVEPRQGEWRFHREPIQQYLDAGFDIVGSWLHCPGWARIERQENDGWLDNWWQPRDYSEFAEYVQQVTRAHADQITHWQIWNEPWGDFWIGAWRPELGPRAQWYAGDSPAEDFARLSQIAYTAGKAANPNIRILGVNATVGERGKTWMRRMLDLNVEHFSDIVTFHAYTGGGLTGIIGTQPESFLHRLYTRVLQPLLNKPHSLQGRGLWLTEGNSLQRGPGSGMYVHTLNGKTDDPVERLQARQALVVYHLQIFAKGVDSIFTYAPNATGAYYRKSPGIYWGALAHPGGELAPEAAAFSTMAWHLDDTDFVYASTSPSKVHRFLFAKKNGRGSVAALIAIDPLPKMTEVPDDASLIVEDLFGNPLRKRETSFANLLWVISDAPPATLNEALDRWVP